jgi:copper oxidase (laccase) domain-containing protein
MSAGVLIEAAQIETDSKTVWLQANKLFGNMLEGFSDDWEQNREDAVDILSNYTVAIQLVRMKALNRSGFVDLDRTEFADVHRTDGFITTNPNLILHANPADCGEIALHGFGVEVGTEVLGLFHASSKIVGEGGHLRGIEYLAKTYGVNPAGMSARLAPSARVESYKFPDIYEHQKTSLIWRDYIYRDPQGYWHIDFHQRTIDDLVDFGIPLEQIDISPIDTIANPTHFSNYRENRTGEQPGANGLLVALR